VRVLLGLALACTGCVLGGRPASVGVHHQIAPMEQPQEAPAPGVDPYAFPALIGISATDDVKVQVRGPIEVQYGQERLMAGVVLRTAWDHVDAILVLARRTPALELLAKVPLANVPTSSVDPREVDARIGRATAGGNDDAIRVDVATFEEEGHHLFAVKTFLIDATAQVLWAHVTEDGSDVRDRRAVLTVRGGYLIVDESEAGRAARRQQIVYRRGNDGVFLSTERSLFDD
jgi:hypothetical protein